MRTKLITAMVLALFLASMSVSSVAACPVKCCRCKPLTCELSLVFIGTGWKGPVTGDIEGNYVWTMQKYTMKDTKEYYFGTWVIQTDGGEISGFDMGVFDYATLKWVAFGRVTATAGSWKCLAGSFMWNSGTASTETGTGEGTLTILPRWRW